MTSLNKELKIVGIHLSVKSMYIKLDSVVIEYDVEVGEIT